MSTVFVLVRRRAVRFPSLLDRRRERVCRVARPPTTVRALRSSSSTPPPPPSLPSAHRLARGPFSRDVYPSKGGDRVSGRVVMWQQSSVAAPTFTTVVSHRDMCDDQKRSPKPTNGLGCRHVYDSNSQGPYDDVASVEESMDIINQQCQEIYDLRTQLNLVMNERDMLLNEVSRLKFDMELYDQRMMSHETR